MLYFENSNPIDRKQSRLGKYRDEKRLYICGIHLHPDVCKCICMCVYMCVTSERNSGINQLLFCYLITNYS
jgi:hypothetical protein